MSQDTTVPVPEIQPDNNQREDNAATFYEISLAHKTHGFLFRCKDVESKKTFVFVVLPKDDFPVDITPDAVPGEWRILNRSERNKFKNTTNRIIV
jgi:hypothetical protein